MIRLGVNIDHVATIRQARRTVEPDPVSAAALAELGGADGITVHLREDRRHIQDRDVRILRQTVRTRLNLEMAVAAPIVAIALEVRPDLATLVPERREEVTTEGGLDVVGQRRAIAATVRRLRAAGITVSLFIDPDADQVAASAESGAELVEFHTGAYADAVGESERDRRLGQLHVAAEQALRLGLRVNAGHGLTYWNVAAVCGLPGLEELNIGHSIISRAVLVGLVPAVREMREAIAAGDPRVPRVPGPGGIAAGPTTGAMVASDALPTDTTSEVLRCRHGLPQERRAGARQDGAQAPARRRETPVSRSATGPSSRRPIGARGNRGDRRPAKRSSGSG